MGCFRILTVLILHFLSDTISGGGLKNDDLLSVVVVYRHGDRNPQNPTYPNDPHRDESNYPEGFGQLINEGIYRQFELGKWLRRRYDGFISKTYNERDIYVRSTDVDRALMSAISNLGGLYPGNETSLKMNWQPIPVHTVPKNIDALLMQNDCPAFSELQSKVYKQYFSQYDNAKLYEYVSKHTGSHIKDLHTLGHIFSTLYIQKRLNFTLPLWTKAVYDKMQPLFIKKFSIDCWTPEAARFKAGVFFDKLIKTFRKKLRNTSDKYQRFVMYSAHDSTIGNIITTLGAFDDELIFYTDTIIFELRSSGIINVFYKKQHVLKNLTTKNCNFDCPLDAFAKILGNILITQEELDEECHHHNQNIFKDILRYLFN